jgi:hypothetical protein
LVTGIHNESLAFLLALNQQRYEMESIEGKKAQQKAASKKPKGVKKVEKRLNIIPPDTKQLDFF